MAEIFRNPSYRRRRVQIELRTQTPPNQPSPSGSEQLPPFDLTEVTSVSIDTMGSVIVLPGAVAAVLQSWYFRPMTIDISGKSYIGAFSNFGGLSNPNIANDNDVEKLLKLRGLVNSLFVTPGLQTNNFGVILRYDDPDDRNNINVSQEYLGFIDDITVDESDSEPFMKTYSVKFIGELKQSFDIQSGKKNSQKDKNTTTKQKMSNIQDKIKNFNPAKMVKVNAKNTGALVLGLSAVGGVLAQTVFRR